MEDMKNNFLLSELIQMELDGVLSDQQAESLQDMLSTDPDAFDYYIETILAISILHEPQGLCIESEKVEDSQCDLSATELTGFKVAGSSNVSLRCVDLKDYMFDVNQADVADSDKIRAMLELLEMERTSPAVVIEKPKPVKPRPEIRKVGESTFKWFPGEGNKPLTRFLLAMAACLMVFFGYVYFNSVSLSLPVVAELVDVIDAEWDDDFQLPDDSGQMRQSTYRLNKGYASIQFNGGAKITVEAPAELSLLGGGNMELFSGRIYAVVPEQAVGFTVTSGGSKIVDLGTEFGVEVDENNNTQLHVTKGRTKLFAGLPNGKKLEVNVDAGAAKKVYSDGYVKDIPVVNEKFVREIDSRTGSILKGLSSVVEVGDLLPHAAPTVSFVSVVDTDLIPTLDNSYGTLELAYNLGFSGADITQDGITFTSVTHGNPTLDPDYGTTNGINVSATTINALLHGFNVGDSGDDLWQTASYTDKNDTLFLNIIGLAATERYQVQILFGGPGTNSNTSTDQARTYDSGTIKSIGSNGGFVTSELKYGQGYGDYALITIEVNSSTSLTFEMPKATLGPSISGVAIHKRTGHSGIDVR